MMCKTLSSLLVVFLLVVVSVQPVFATLASRDLDRRVESAKRSGIDSEKERARTRPSKRSRTSKPTSPETKKRTAKRISPKTELEGQASARLADGRWLLLGGTQDGKVLDTAVIIDEATATRNVLQSRMTLGRTRHTATLLPDGNVLIIGGRRADGRAIGSAEIFNVGNETFQSIDVKKLLTRSDHTATLMTNGWILVAGGIGSDDEPVIKAELINAASFERQLVSEKLNAARQNHTAELRSDGSVLLRGGVDQNLIAVPTFESFDPETKSFSIVGEPPLQDKNETPAIGFSLPGNGDTGISVDARPVVRFSALINAKTINAQTVRLTTSGVEVQSRVVPAENGRLLFVTPTAKLEPDTTYYLELRGLYSEFERQLPDKIIAFKTDRLDGPAAPTGPVKPHQHHDEQVKQIVDEDSWLPGDERFKKQPAPLQDPTPLRAPDAVTGVSGRVLSLSGKPLAGVTIVLQEHETVTDLDGRFVVRDLKPVQSGMVIHGETVNSPGKTYGTFEVLVDIDEGETNVLPYTVFLPVIDKANEVELTAPTLRETVVTTPRLPGMEVKIAADSVLKMPKGHGMSRNLADMNSGHQMTKIGITPIPAERPPFPLPSGIEEALVFTLQMHGAKVEGPAGEKRPGLRFSFPNAFRQTPGSRVSFWNYDSTAAGWAWYGYGTVSKDGQKVIPDADVELDGMQCLSLMTGLLWAPDGPQPGDPGWDGDPVHLKTGLFVHQQTDLVLPDTIPIDFTRTYRQNDGARDFGPGFTHPYNMFIAGDTFNYGYLILPDGGRVRFDRDQSNTSETVYRHTETPTAFYKAELRYLSGSQTDHPEGAWEIRMRNGTRLIFARKTIFGDILGVHISKTALHQIIDRFGNKVTLNRDDNLRLTRISSPNNKWIEVSYEGALSRNVTQIRDNIGRTVSYTYDGNGRLVKVTDPQGGEAFYTYDSAGRMLTLKDQSGFVNLTNEYDAAGRVKKQTSADGTTYQFAYGIENGRVVRTDVTNPRGLVRRVNFNSDDYPISETFGLGRPDLWTYTYERTPVSNHLTSVTDSWNQKTAFSYDDFGNILSTTNLHGTPDAVTVSATYTQFDNVASETDVLNRTSNFTYDGTGQLTEARDWLNRPSTYTYNNRGQVVTATDNLNRTSRFTYDRGALVESEDPTGRRVRSYLDAAGRVTRIYDPLGGVTKLRYNKFNRPVEATDPAGRTAALLHDAVGNILEITDSRGNKIKYTYDSMRRPLTRTDQLNQVETYQYDAYGNLWKATDHKGQVTELTYDVFNRPTLVKYHDNSTTAYSYDEKARVSSVTDSTGGTITYGYDVYDRVNSETTAQGTVNYVYDVGDRLTSMDAPNQPSVSYGYDTADRLQSITQDGQVVSFTYDDADRRTTMTLPNGIVAYYVYDTVSQLKSLTYKRGTTVIGDVSFEYDGNGRRTHVSGSLAEILSPGTFDNGTYDAANQQNSVNSQSLTFDSNGNLTSDSTNTYTWNARDELVSISGPNLTASFAYDAEGRRISKTINGITTTYVYDGLQAVEEYQQSGPTTTQLAGGLDEVFFRKTGTNVEFLLTDALGSTWGLADSNGDVNTEYKYDVFGGTQQSGQSSNNPLQFTGRENDGTGLYYYRNRYYAPALRRFISRDPLGEAAGENEYSYVGNNPVRFADPLGLMQDEPWNPLNEEKGDVVSNVAAGTINFIVDGDGVAQDAQTIGNYCLPISERRWAAARMAFRIVEAAVGGVLVGKAFKLLGRVIKRIPWGQLSRIGKKACFVAGTLIHTTNGLVPIEEIKAGDEVLSYNQATKENEYKEVIATFVKQTETIVELRVENDDTPVSTTPEHPFFVKPRRAESELQSSSDGEWREAGDLEVGDEVFSVAGTWSKLIEVQTIKKLETVYNFTAAENHNYYVGAYGTLVHNIQCTDLARLWRKKLGGGSIARLTNPKGYENLHLDLPRGMYPGRGQFDYHDVFIKDGMVYDSLSKYGDIPIPFKTWWSEWGAGSFTKIARFE